MDWNKLANSKPENALSIFCGVLEYSEQILKQIQRGEKFGFENWEVHVKIPGLSSSEIVKGFNKYYYESFVNTVFPDTKNKEKQYLNKDFANETIRLSKPIQKEVPVSFGKGKESVILNIKFEYLDLYFFPHGIVLYCFKCDLNGFTLDEITLINSQIRNIGVNPNTQFISDQLLFLKEENPENTKNDFLSFGNKLKVYSLIEHNEKLSPTEENCLLYDLGVCAPIGTGAGTNSFFSPSEEYLHELIENNRISVFKNWSAIALFDTFTGVFKKGAFDNFVWEIGYFNLLYIQSLFVKNFLFKINREFYSKGANQQVLEDQFFNFNKTYNQSHISFNFLPPLLFHKIRFSLAINDELTLMKDGIERANIKFKEKRDKMINDILTVIALLTIFSVIWDLSEWINKLFSGETYTYNIISGSLTGIVTLILTLFLIKNYRKEH